MRVLILFDLPVETSEERLVYSRFRRSLLKDGYVMMQKSVYSKLVMSPLAAELAKERVAKLKPDKGVIQLLVITEKQYAQIEYLLGGPQTKQLTDTERLVIF